MRSQNETRFGLTLGGIANVHDIFTCGTLEAVILLLGFKHGNHVLVLIKCDTVPAYFLILFQLGFGEHLSLHRVAEARTTLMLKQWQERLHSYENW